MTLRKLPVLLCVLLASGTAIADNLKIVNRDGRQTEYEGSLSVSGRFERRQDAETLDWRGDRVCFYPDAAGLGALPREAAGKRSVWFCFSNHRAATEQLHLAAAPQPGSCGVTGTATVSISHYVADSGNSGDIFDQAWLDKVVQQGPTSPLRCP